MSQALKSLEKDLQNLANPAKAKILSGFFKTGKGQYGEGDVFLGIIVPEQRKLVKKYWKDFTLDDIESLLESTIHEYRLVGVLSLVAKFEKGSQEEKITIFDFYLSKTSRINNWDLVDLSADRIVGGYLLPNRPYPSFGTKGNDVKNPGKLSKSSSLDSSLTLRMTTLQILTTLAHSTNLWEQRISIIATFAFIKVGIHEPTFEIAELLLHHKHDLIHKAVGWMLREVGKRISEELEETFLQEFASQMPRTMLRYAIERFKEEKRLKYLSMKSAT